MYQRSRHETILFLIMITLKLMCEKQTWTRILLAARQQPPHPPQPVDKSVGYVKNQCISIVILPSSQSKGPLSFVIYP